MPHSVPLTRRAILRATVATAGALSAGCSGSDGPTAAPESLRHFPQSVASGDPRPDGVVLWTRLAPDDETLSGPAEVELEVALDPEFRNRVSLDGGPRLRLSADPAHDGCIKVRLAGLSPDTVYYYRFLYEDRNEGLVASPTGRTWTAPTPDADRPVRFAFVSCQDYIGRYYNALARLADMEIDFFVHLGDYIYETSGDPGFQQATEDRAITFDDADGALTLGEPGATYQAARSLDNYRQLYRTYRRDPALQRLHATVPMVAIWDDHEFADDSWGATATHFGGRMDETDVERRKNANQAWTEYMPADLGEGFSYDRNVPFPDDLAIFRDLRIGRHVHLFMTDLRTRRSDHLVPEDAYPGAVVVAESDLADLGGNLPDVATPYVPDIETFAGGQYVAPLVEHAQAAGADPAKVRGPVSVAFLHQVLADLASPLPPIDDATIAGLPRGISYYDVGKVSYFGRLGSRYLVAKEPFEILALHRFRTTAGTAQTAMGDAQRAWFLDGVRGSDATWKIWGNEYCLVSMVVDLSALPIPDFFRRRFYINVDGWDGFPDRRDEILDALADTPGVVALTGDIHAFFAATPWVRDNRSRRIFEFVTAGVSSQPLSELLAEAADDLDVAGADALASNIAELFLVTGGPNPYMAFAKATHHGFGIVEASAQSCTVSLYIAGPEIVASQRYDEDLSAAFEVERFQVRPGDGRLYRDFGGAWRYWDDEGFLWVDA